MPLPGVTITAVNTLTGQKAITWTGVAGRYTLQVPANGRYVIRAQMTAFAPLTHEVLINAANSNAQADLEMVLRSRAQQTSPNTVQSQIAALAGTAANLRGFQSLSVLQSEGADQMSSGAEQIAPAGMPIPGIAADSATESVAVSGNTSNPMGAMSGDEFRQRIAEFRDQAGGIANASSSGRGEGGFGGGFGGGGGGGGGGGAPIAIFLGGGRGGRFNINQPHGSFYYSAANSALDAAPYALTPQSSPKSAYMQNRFGGSLGGPLNIPHLYHGGTKTFFFINYNGSRAQTPYDQFSTVPTLLERQGDFSQSTILSRAGGGAPTETPVQLFYPNTNQPIPGNNLQNSGLNISPIAQGLLRYIPLPNLPTSPGSQQNFHYVTAVENNSDDVNIRVNHTFGAAPTLPTRMPRGGFSAFRIPRNNLTFGFHYHASTAAQTNPFPTVAGSTGVRSFDIPIAYIRSIGKLTNIARFDFNRNRVHTQNLYANSQNIAGSLGIGGISQNPFDWGLPNLSFRNFGSLNDINPLLQRNQTLTFSDQMIWNYGKHTWRWGGDFRRIQLNNETDSDARGSFAFSGLNSSEVVNGQVVPNTGFDFADFLLGLPQQTSLQRNSDPLAPNSYHFRGNSWDLFAQDEWKVRGNLTLNLGVRYEYVSPFTELNNRTGNLILSPGFLNQATATRSLTEVLPGQGYPATLVHPDRGDIAPRIGLAWKPFSKTVVRAGYGINYNTGAYQSIAQNLAFQPPFAVTETNVQSVPGQLTLACGFPSTGNCGASPPTSLITNNFAVDPNYRLGYVQIRNLDIQQELRPTLLLNIDYTGTKGTHLDNVLAPNSLLDPATGLPVIPVVNAQAFTWQTSQASSAANAGSVRLRKRLQRGISIGGTYTFSKSIDNASSIGNGIGINVARGGAGSSQSGSTVVAQNPFDLAAERGLSSFDQRHRFTADYLYELPFGRDKRWLSGSGPLRAMFGDWQWNGDWTIQSGLPFTPRFVNDIADLSRGENGTIRAEVVPGQPVSLPNPSINEWFNVNAFTRPLAYGDARRNSIEGPGEVHFNMAMTKVIPIRETRVLEIRASASNIFNHPQFTTIDTNVNSPTFGRVISVGAMRTLLLTARFRF